MRSFVSLLMMLALLGCEQERAFGKNDGGEGGTGDVGAGGSIGTGGSGGGGVGGKGGKGGKGGGSGGGQLGCVRPPKGCTSNGLEACEDVCRHTISDPQACGGCGKKCTEGERCFKGVCRRACGERVSLRGHTPRIKLGEEADGMAFGDFDRDGIVDVVVCLPIERRIAVLHRTQGRKLKPPLFYETGGKFTRAAVMDLNRDGWPDLVLASTFRNSSDIGVIWNREGEFRDAEILIGGLGTVSKLEVRDLDRDGIDDLVVAAFSGVVGWFPGLPEGGIGEIRGMSISRASDLLVEDIDRDGNLDILVASKDEKKIWLLWGDGVGNFSGSALQLDGEPFGLSILESDDLPTLVVGENGDVTRIVGFEQSQARAFDDAKLVSGQGQTQSRMQVADLDGDGMPDLITVPKGEARVRVEPLSSLAERPSLLYPIGAPILDMEVLDWDLDGFPDVVVSDVSGHFSVFFGEGSLVFSSAKETEIGDRIVQILPGDFDGDGRDDVLLIRGRGPPLDLRRGRDDWTVGREPVGPELRASSGAVGDFNGDGVLDVAIAEREDQGSLVVFLGDGKGDFEQVHRTTIGKVYKLVAADFDGDGILDLAGSANTDGRVRIFRGMGGGDFEPWQDVVVKSFPGGLVAADLDGDGWTDLAVARNGAERISLFYNDGKGKLEPCGELIGGLGPLSLQSGDVDGDGLLDLVVGNWDGESVTIHFQQQGGGWQREDTFLGSPLPWESAAVRQVMVADLDGDGTNELLVARWDGNLHVLQVGADRKFTWREASNLGEDVFSAGLADMNGDGLLDMVVGTGARLRVIDGSCEGANFVSEED